MAQQHHHANLSQHFRHKKTFVIFVSQATDKRFWFFVSFNQNTTFDPFSGVLWILWSAYMLLSLSCSF
jgi:hypothetical protein